MSSSETTSAYWRSTEKEKIFRKKKEASAVLEKAFLFFLSFFPSM